MWPSLQKKPVMHYPIAIETGTSTETYGVVVPDLPGCFSASNTLDEAIENAKRRLSCGSKSLSTTAWLCASSSPWQSTSASADSRDGHGGLVTIDIASLSDKAECVNIILPSRVLRRIDQAAKAAGESRSGYMARRALG
jgi:hypothetical protein